MLNLTTKTQKLHMARRSWGLYTIKVAASAIVMMLFVALVLPSSMQTMAQSASYLLGMAPSQLAYSPATGWVDPAIYPGNYQWTEVGAFVEYGYGLVSDTFSVVTILMFSLVLWWPLDKCISTKRAFFEFIALGSIPIAVHLIGTAYYNSLD